MASLFSICSWEPLVSSSWLLKHIYLCGEGGGLPDWLSPSTIGSQDLNLGPQAWQQVPLPAELSLRPQSLALSTSPAAVLVL